MTERNVTVRLKMVARDYMAGAGESARMTDRLADSQRDMAGAARKAGDEMDRAGRRAEIAGRRMARGAAEATAAHVRLAGSARQAGEELDRAAGRAEAFGRRSRRSMLYAAAGFAALGAAGGAIKVLPGLLSATAVAGAALPPLLLGTAQAGGVLATSLKGVGAAAGEVLKSDDPFAGLGKNARAFVAEVKALQPVMSGVRQGIQDRTLANADRDLHILATRTLPLVRGGLNELATDWGEAFTAITLGVSDPRFVRGFNTAATGADWFFDMLNARIPETLGVIGTLIDSADPLARAFGQSLINSLDRFNAAVERASRSGSLEAYFERGAEGAAAFMDIAAGVLSITGMVVREVQKQGGTLDDTRAALDAYIASGRAQADVAGIVHTLTTSYEGLKDVLGPLGAIARDALADPATADALRTMFDVAAAGAQVLQVLFGLFQALPGPMQTAVLVAIALGIAYGKLTKAMALMQGAAGRAAVSLEKTGTAGARAGRGLRAAAAGAGAAAAALVGLQLAGIVLDQFDDSAPKVDALGRALETFAKKGQVGGELARLFGNDLQHMNKIAGAATKDGWLTKIGLAAESLVPPVKNLNEIFQGGSFTGSIERMQALDAELAHYARTTGDLTSTQELWNRAFNASGLDMQRFAEIMPSSTAELERLQGVAHAGTAGMQAQSERAKILAGSFQEAALAGKDLATTMDLINGKNISAIEGQIRLEEAYDKGAEVVDKFGRVTKKGTNEIDLGTQAGRESMAVLVGIQQAAVAAADAEVKRTNNTAAGAPILNAARDRFIALAKTMTGSASAAEALADEIFGIPNKDVKVTAKTAKSKEDLEALGFTVKRLPNGKLVVVGAKTKEAEKQLKEAKAAVDRINSKTITITVRQNIAGVGQRRSGVGGGGTILEQATGGVNVPYGRPIAAAMGLVRPNIYAPSDPPLYQFAERETGGELFLPRRGIDMGRGRALLAIAASWYGGMFVPMARGGARVQAAASGLVNVAPAGGSRGTTTGGRLDSIEAYIAARDALTALNTALKENGRSFSLSTVKGRENQKATYAAIRAAQEAARAKFEETGSVKAANAVYDAHIGSLRRVLAQQGVNAKTVRQMIATAGRPIFDVPPVNSESAISSARATIAANAGAVELADRLSLNRAGVDLTTEHGRENLTAILDFLALAEQVAQARFKQTGSAALAEKAYQSHLAQLRQALAAAGYTSAGIAGLINMYGKITLQPNERGGVYMAAAGGWGTLGQAQVYPGNAQPMYGWAEKSTGGELFVPRLGDRARGERLLSIGAGWYGGRYLPAGAGGGGPTTINNNLTVHALRADLSIGELQGLMRQMDVEARVGRRR